MAGVKRGREISRLIPFPLPFKRLPHRLVDKKKCPIGDRTFITSEVGGGGIGGGYNFVGGLILGGQF